MGSFNQLLNNGRAMFGGNGELDLNGYHEVPPGSSDMFVDEVHSGLRNLWYSATGQTEKTSAYKAQMEREDSAYQRLAKDLQSAGLSKFNVGSASPQTGSYGSGAPQMLSMLSAIADIKKANAESSLIGAQAQGQENINRTFDEKFQADLEEIRAGTYLKSMQGKIASIEGEWTAEKCRAELSNLTSTASLNLKKLALAEKDLEYADRDHMADLNLKNSSTNVNIHRKAAIDKQIELFSQQISESIARENNLNEQSKKVVADTAYQILNTSVLQSDWDYSVYHQLRYKDQANNILGINLDSMANHFGIIQEGVRNGVDSISDFVKSAYSNVFDFLKGFF